ncbi:OsmC family protein [Roseateles sp. DAIF2]|uniref:OsmC family protein n=1 Tax=Roseateles sp. DAIF2 TaxID=2714952 RepID=UPI0018A2B45E|nr:OsmC family protein [Roseateles sp. DAIF2]QPF74309.1 OsmC family protein [Roseateles sp. DAIF2]
MADQQTIRGHLQQRSNHQFEARFEGVETSLLSDEPPPLGQSAGPSPVQLLGTAVGTCLSNSLLFALRKFKQNPEPLSCELETTVGRNEQGRMRVLAIHARLRLGVPAASLAHLERVLEQFEDYCTVTQSVRAGIPVQVSVFDADGVQLK